MGIMFVVAPNFPDVVECSHRLVRRAWMVEKLGSGLGGTGWSRIIAWNCIIAYSGELIY